MIRMLIRIAAAAAVAQTSRAASQAPFQLTRTTLSLHRIPYFVAPSPVSHLDVLDYDILPGVTESETTVHGLVPISVIPTVDADFGDDALATIVQTWQEKDDVWNTAFLSGIYISYNGNGSCDAPAISLTPESQEQYGIKFVFLSACYTGGIGLRKELPSGPYFLDPLTGNIFEAYRLYSDETQSFLYGTIPDGSGGYDILPAKVSGAATETIGVPSRLYFTPTPEKPLAGARFAVKDIFDIEGLRTGCGSRAYWGLYPPRNRTAPAVQRLLDGGLVLVGKTKTSQFANGELATNDWVDIHAPYNPRGDGYQDGSASSTGSGTAVAAYPWLDYTVGSDTGGSMRGPAGANGVFGNRPSLGAVSMDGAMPISPELDTAGLFSRDAKAWRAVGHWWYQNFTTYYQFPKKILVPVDCFNDSYLTHPPADGTAAAIFDSFIERLEAFLGTTRTEVNLTSLWLKTKPSNISSTLDEMLNTTYAAIFTTDQTSLVAESFFADYAAMNDGRKPFVNPVPLARWTYGWSLPAGARSEGVANKTVFMDWFASEVMIGSDPKTCSESIMIYPQSSGEPKYRNMYPGSPPLPPFGFQSRRIAVFAETPDMVVPIGEMPYNSTITGKTEYLPVTVSFIAAKGCDLMLFDLFAALQDAGIIKPVITGSRLFG